MDAVVGLAAWSYALASLVSIAFSAYLIRSGHLGAWRDPSAASFFAAVAATAAWGMAAAIDEFSPWTVSTVAAVALDMLRYGLWMVFLLTLSPAAQGRWTLRRPGWLPAVTVLVVLVAAATNTGAVYHPALSHAAVASGLALGVVGLVLLEQLFRNQGEDSRWNAKPVCLALGFNFAFDVYLHTEAFMFGRFDPDAVSLRGVVYAATTPLLFIASRRHAAWISKLKVSRTAAFYSASLLLIGAYLLFVAGVGYYVRYFGGDWGRALQLGLLLVALLVLAVVLLSGSLRARLRVFLSKNFFSYRYDYRKEWLRFTARLSSDESPHEVGCLVIQGLADLVESPGGSLWSRGSDDDVLTQTARWNAPSIAEREEVSSSFCRYLLDKDWILDLAEYRTRPRLYEGLVVPPWLSTGATAWVVIPLLVGEQLVGFVVLAPSRATIDLNWEVRDLLKTAARQAATVLAHLYAAEALLESRKFEAFNRMSAFVVHDLKNIVTQQSLMLKNAERHRDNPEFQQDMLMTIQNSLEKMRQMILQLREGHAVESGRVSGVDLSAVLQRIVESAGKRQREVQLHIVEALATRGDEDRLERVIGHLVQNALDATTPEGLVSVHLEREGGRVRLRVVDTGVGMTQEFIQTRLYRPFSSTKPTGMGIGAYESHLYVKELGGRIDVDSEVGKGTVVTLLLPLLDLQRGSDLVERCPPRLL